VSVTHRQPVVTLLTDYGTTDEFAGVLHGVIARICPEARVIDISHGVISHDIRGGAAILAQSLPYMPTGVHVAVVDPTVGSDRRAVALRLADGRVLVGPDNGLLWPAAQAAGGVEQAVEISRSPWTLQPVSATFHGRDIFAPVAAHLAAGEALERAGDPIDPAVLVRLETRLARTDGNALEASVNSIDRFGNVQLQAVPDDLSALGVRLGDQLGVELDSGELHIGTYAHIFSDVEEGELLIFEDSSGKLALALNRGGAAARFGLSAGDELRLTSTREL
jgi:S-adenosylmethionine hydrolase